MPSSIVVGTDGSDTATKAVREAVVMARALGATLDIVSAYAPVSAAVKLRAAAHVSSGRMAPEDVQWALNPQEDIEACLTEAADIAREVGVNVNTGRPCRRDPRRRAGAGRRPRDRREQGNDRCQALADGLGAQQRRPSSPMLGDDRPDDLRLRWPPRKAAT